MDCTGKSLVSKGYYYLWAVDILPTRNIAPTSCVQCCMQVQELDSRTFERIAKQGEFLTREYQAELGRDHMSSATKSSRSNLIALGQTVSQMYGEDVARDANLVPKTVAHFLSFKESGRESSRD